MPTELCMQGCLGLACQVLWACQCGQASRDLLGMGVPLGVSLEWVGPQGLLGAPRSVPLGLPCRRSGLALTWTTS